MRLSILSTVVGAWLLGAAAAHAEVPTITEPELVAAIQARDPRIARGAAEVSQAGARAAAAAVRPNPSLSIDREEPFVDGGGLPTNYLRLIVPFDLSGRRGLGMAAAERDVQAARHDVDRASFTIVLDGLRVFHDAAHARLQVDLLAAERESLVRAAQVVRARGKAGDASGYEVRRIELELAAYDDLLATARLELQQSRQRLATLAGRSELELDAASSLPASGAVPALDALLQGAVEARGDHRAARLRIDASQRRMRAADRGWIPVPALTAGAITTDLGDRTATGYVAGLLVTIPLFDHGQAEHAQAAADRQLAEADARWIATQVPAQIRAAYATLAARTEQAGSVAASQLDRLDAMIATAETAFREGDASLVELLDAHRAARDVRLRALALRHAVALARLDLELALGHRL